MQSPTKCKICNHRAVDEINRLLLTDRTANDKPVTLGYIQNRMNKAYPDTPITMSGLSRHKAGHLLAQPLAVQNENGEIEFFGTKQIDQKRPPVAEDIELELNSKQAAEFVIGIGLKDIAAGRLRVSGDMFTKVLMKYMETYGQQNSDDKDVTKEAWDALNKEKTKARKVTVTKVASITETTEEIDSPQLPVLASFGDVIEGESEVISGQSEESGNPATNT